MAKTRCSNCGEMYHVSLPRCPYCGESGTTIDKAAAGLDTLVTLGDVIHQRGGGSGVSMSYLCNQFKKDCSDSDLLDILHEVRAGQTSYMLMIGSAYADKKKRWLPHDYSKARQWYELAVQHGDSDGSRHLELLDEILELGG